MGGEDGPPAAAWDAPVATVAEGTAEDDGSWSAVLLRCALLDSDMIVCAGGFVFSLFLLLEAEDPVLDVGGSWDVAVTAFNPEESLLLVVGAAEIDAICGSMQYLFGLCDTCTAIQI